MNKEKKILNIDRIIAIISIVITVLGFFKEIIQKVEFYLIIGIILITILLKYLLKRHTNSTIIRRFNIKETYRGFFIIPLFLSSLVFFQSYFRNVFLYETLIFVSIGIVISSVYWKYSKSKWITIQIILLFFLLFVIEDYVFDTYFNKSLETELIKDMSFADFMNKKELELCTQVTKTKREYKINDNKIEIFDGDGRYLNEINFFDKVSQNKILNFRVDKNNTLIALSYGNNIDIWHIKRKQLLHTIDLDYDIDNEEFAFDFGKDKIRVGVYYKNIAVVIHTIALKNGSLELSYQSTHGYSFYNKSKKDVNPDFPSEPIITGYIHDLFFPNYRKILVVKTATEIVVWHFKYYEPVEIIGIFRNYPIYKDGFIANKVHGDKDVPWLNRTQAVEIWEIDKEDLQKICQIPFPTSVYPDFFRKIKISENKKYLEVSVKPKDDYEIVKTQIFDIENCELLINTSFRTIYKYYRSDIDSSNKYTALSGVFEGNKYYYIYIYNIKTGKKVKVLKGHKFAVRELKISECGNYLYSMCKKEFKVWDLRDLE